MDIKCVQTILSLGESGIVISKADRVSEIFGKVTHLDEDYFIINTVKFLKVSPSKAKGKKIILCTVFGKRIGIIVDSIIEFISLDTLFIEKNIDFNVYQEDKYISWYLDYQARKILYPNFEKIAKELSTSGFFLSLLQVW